MKTEEYKSIEDLLDRCFEGQTSNEEEQGLYEFFARPDIPAHLERYREVFGYFESTELNLKYSSHQRILLTKIR